jgi:glycerol-3-phosphate dehydrogenase
MLPPAPDADEILYLCQTVNSYFREQIAPDDVVWAFAGVRSLYDDHANKPEDVTRDYVLTFDADDGQAPLLSVYGGKITTYRRLAEAAMVRLAPFLGASSPWTAGSALPGGDFPVDGVDNLVTETLRRWSFLAKTHAWRLVRAYGRRVERILKNAQSMDDLGPRFAGDLTGAEVRYLVESEWAFNAEDVLWRRSKLGLKATPEQLAALDAFIAPLRPAP